MNVRCKKNFAREFSRVLAKSALITGLSFANIAITAPWAMAQCYKDCGCTSALGSATRSCSGDGNTCWVTDCIDHADGCGYPPPDNHNDICTVQPYLGCMLC